MLKASFITHELIYLNNLLFSNAVAPQMKELRDCLLQHGIECATSDIEPPELADFIVVNRLDLVFGQVVQAMKRNPKLTLVLLAFEEPLFCGLHEAAILPWLDVDAVFSWRDDLALIPHFNKINIPQSAVVLSDAPPINFADRKLLVAIDGFKTSLHPNEAYSKRRETLRGLVKTGLEVDLFGRGWDKCRDRVLRSIWHGMVASKYEIQCQYRFTLCIQNATGYPGDICEKIFDAFKAGSIPIYQGAPNIAEHIPSNCFVDLSTFETSENLAKFIQEFSEAEYNKMYSAITVFMNSGFKERFTSEALAKHMGPRLLQLKDAGPHHRNHIVWSLHSLYVVARSLSWTPRISKWRALFEMGRSLVKGR